MGDTGCRVREPRRGLGGALDSSSFTHRSITISPVSVAALGLVSQARGLSLRFPRFMSIREDKGVEDASTPEFLANMYRTQQATGKDQAGADEGELVDVALEDDEREEEEDAGDSEEEL